MMNQTMFFILLFFGRPSSCSLLLGSLFFSASRAFFFSFCVLLSRVFAPPLVTTNIGIH